MLTANEIINEKLMDLNSVLTPLPEITEEMPIDEVMQQCYLSTKVTAKTLFPNLFTAPFSILHDKIFELVDSGVKRIAIAAPRGIGKTTIARTLVKKAILFRDVNFVVYVSNSATSAEMQTENIKRELLTNEIVRHYFGSIKISDYEGGDETFSKKSWVAYGNTFILPRGAGQQVRGLNWAGHRPELVIIDDLEDKKEVKNEDIRFATNEWFNSDLMKTEDKYSKPCTFIYIDTIKHEDCQLQRLIDTPSWKGIVLSICDEKFNSYDTNYMTTEELKEEYQEAKDNGDADLFYMERMNIPISKEDAVFKPEYFKYFTQDCGFLRVHEKDKTVSVRARNLMTVVIVDPAKTVKLQSAESAVVVISVDRKHGRIFVRDVISEKVDPEGLYDNMFNAVLSYDARVLAVEVTSLHLFISQPIENEMRVRGIFPLYHELNAQGKKEDRVAMLAGNYKLGYMYHNKDNCQQLENQLQWFPRSKKWDVMDATAYIIKVMAELSFYFDPEDLGDDLEEEYSELEFENESIIQNWRQV